MFWENDSGHRQQHGVEVGKAEEEQPGITQTGGSSSIERRERFETLGRKPNQGLETD